ncbi:MAG: hypothetical protein VW268_12515, partial [Rhodospirillaceae bacterium]
HRPNGTRNGHALTFTLDQFVGAGQRCRQVADFLKRNHLPSVTLETNGLGRFPPGLLLREIHTAKVDAVVLEQSSS